MNHTPSPSPHPAIKPENLNPDSGPNNQPTSVFPRTPAGQLEELERPFANEEVRFLLSRSWKPEYSPCLRRILPVFRRTSSRTSIVVPLFLQSSPGAPEFLCPIDTPHRRRQELTLSNVEFYRMSNRADSPYVQSISAPVGHWLFAPNRGVTAPRFHALTSARPLVSPRQVHDVQTNIRRAPSFVIAPGFTLGARFRSEGPRAELAGVGLRGWADVVLAGDARGKV
ncbi:hypothetical protein EJ06DRAFT_530099 [Trichodelitschia bisporula]|uniref:Uncharacterized protein n=1 Tax=Trichodelitschia bisporula TaxID=703511 RepID=A0A6G1HYN0_9PEZI|nr:hypothetical protein EJ06DRAFT_530099 [Trichodelitschia bisporula]